MVKLKEDIVDNAHPTWPRYRLRASTVGNPDFRQDPTKPLYGAKDLNTCVTAATAPRVLGEWISRYDIGGGNLSDAILYDLETGDEVGRMSYNGRVWPANSKWTSGQKSLEVTPDGTYMDPNKL